MTRRDFLQAVAAGLGLFATCSTIATAHIPIDHSTANSSRPNIILCMGDDHGWGDTAYNGHPVLSTPNLDEMAASSLRFDRFYAAAPVCSPTRGSVLTGRHPNRFGCFFWGYPLHAQEITIAEALKRGGYATGHFGKWHLGPLFQGTNFDPGANGFDVWCSANYNIELNPVLTCNGVEKQFRGESSEVIVTEAISFIRERVVESVPFLAVVWFGSPHLPHQSSTVDRALYSEQPADLQRYYGEITALDRAMGTLRQELRTLGIEDNTILWYCGDNGGLPGRSATGGRGNKFEMYEGGLRVPALLEWPAQIPSPRHSNIPCSTSDIFATLVDIVGVQIEPQLPLDGVSLVPLLKGEMSKRPRPIGFWQYPAEGIKIPSLSSLSPTQGTLELSLLYPFPRPKEQYPNDTFPGHAVWLDWPWKLHRIELPSGYINWELYNLEDDPGETTDLAAQQIDRVSELGCTLEWWQARVVASLNGDDYRIQPKKNGPHKFYLPFVNRDDGCML